MEERDRKVAMGMLDEVRDEVGGSVQQRVGSGMNRNKKNEVITSCHYQIGCGVGELLWNHRR